MKLRIGYIIFIVWLILAVLTYGIEFAYWQEKYPTLAEKYYWQDVTFSAVYAVAVPLSLPAVLIHTKCGTTYGLRYK